MKLTEDFAHHATEVMLADGILSKEEDSRHMRDHGLCYSLGINWEEELLPLPNVGV